MSRPALEVADIFRDHGAAWRGANAGHVSLDQMKVMSAIEHCRTAALGGHVARCENATCAHTIIAYNSCRNRHCPKCQGAAAREWLAEREAELLPVPYFHVVYTLPAAIRDIAYQNKAVIYDLLFKASAETTLKIAATPRHLGARIGFMSVLHTWGSALTHHPHVHMVVPGGGLSPGGSRWIACRPRYFVPVEVLSALFRRLFLEMLVAAHDAGHLQFFGEQVRLADKAAFDDYLTPLRKVDWVVYAKEPFAGPEQVLRYLSRYTHRIAISNRRLVSADEKDVVFKYKDYRIEGPGRYKTMTLATDEFIRRFLIHSPPPRRRGCCPRASIASDTMGCSPAATEPQTLRTRVSCSLCRLAQKNPRRPRPLPPTSRARCRVHARAAAAACSSSRPSRAAASRSTGPHRRRRRSGSTPHDDAVTGDRPPLRHSPCPLARRQPRPSSHPRSRFAACRTANRLAQRAARPFTPTCSLRLCGKPIAATAAITDSAA
jgi:hypothetical protein